MGKLEAVKKFFTRGISTMSPRVLRAHRSQAIRSIGDESMVAIPALMGADKALGKKKVRKTLWNHVHKNLLDFDTAAGAVANDVTSHTTPFSKLFTHKEKLPWGKGMTKEVERTSLTAPLTKSRKLIAPLILAEGAHRALKGDSTKEASAFYQGIIKRAASKL